MTSSFLQLEPSAFQDLWIEQLACSTNDTLSSQEQGIIRELISETQGGIDSIDADIARLEAVLEGLKERRALSIERMMRLRVGIVPQKKLPPEILAKIFNDGAVYEEVEIPRKRTHCLAWDLSHVCTRWRGIARTECLPKPAPLLLEWLIWDYCCWMGS